MMKVKFSGRISDGEVLELGEGLTATVTIPWDDTGRGTPWDEEDGHGIIREGRAGYTGHIPTAPGEVVIWQERGWGYVYDVPATIQKAKAEGWGLPEKDREGMTPKQVVAEAVRRDMDRMRGYLNDVWGYVGVVVKIATEDGEEVAQGSVWGIESDAGDYFAEVANDILHDLTSTLADRLHEMAGDLHDRAGRLVDLAERYWQETKAGE